MSRFKRTKIKSSKKSSVSIDEKIAALNKELEKTNMLSEQPTMNTDNVRSTSEYVPPSDSSEADVPDPGGDTGVTTDNWTQPLGNDPSGNPASAPPTSFPRIWNDPGYSDPTDGLLNKDNLHGDGAALDIWNLPDWQDPADVPSGGVGGVQIEVGGMDPGIVGGYLDVNGFHQTTGKLGGITFKSHPELFKPVKYWTNFSIYNPFIDSYWPGNSLGRTPQYQGIVKGSESGGYALFTAYKFVGGGRAKYNIPGNPPGNTNPQRRGNEDPPIYPGPIANFFDLGERAYDWLKKKAEEWWNDLKNQNYSGRNKPNEPGSGFPDSKPEPDPTKPDPTGGYTPTPQGGRGGGQGNPTNPRGDGTTPTPTPTPNTPSSPTPTGPYTPTPQGGSGGGQGNQTNQPGSGTQTQTQTSSTSTEPDYDKNRKNNRPDVTGGGKAEELLQAGVATMLDITDNPSNIIKYAVQGLLNLGGLLTGQDAIATSFNNLVHHTNNNNPLHPDFRKNDPSSPNYEGPAEVQTSDENRQNIVNALNDSISNLNGGKGPRNPNGNLYNDEIDQVSDDMKKKYKNNKTNQAYNTFYNSFHSLPTGGDRGDGKPITTVTVKDGKFEKLDSNYYFTDPVDANPLLSDKKTGLDYKDLPSTIISNIIHGVTTQATGAGKWTEGSDGKPFYSDENKTEIIGTQYNTQQSFTAKPPKSNKNVKESYITESVRLGFFEPKIMDVNLADIKKGIMPEYPNKPPAKMIDGYHEKSRIRPREAKNIIPTLKIDKVDLIRNHRLKPSEADEMMNTIKMINAYIKKHPEDFIHAQMRYPKDDPRLAELNWKMDQMLDAGKEYLDTNFKENQTLFKRAAERTKKNTALTNPDYIQKHYDELRGTTKPEPRINKKSPSRFFKKPKKKSSMEAINDKIKQLDKDLLI